MRQRIHVSIALFLCFIATGAQWDLIQTYAWGRMVANYSRTMPLSTALKTTFDGKMCNICRIVANARKQEQSRSGIPETKIESRVLLFFQPVPRVIVEAPLSVAWVPNTPPAITEGRVAPPVPPPRAALA